MTIATAKIIAHSVYAQNPNIPFITFELEMPRIILAELNTHRALSSNTSSSRAIPSNSIIAALETNMFIPEYVGENIAGMQAKKELDDDVKAQALAIWIAAGRSVAEATKRLAELKMHKQLSSRISEAFQFVRVCLSGTDFANFYWLRDHADAQPEIQELAKAMIHALEKSAPKVLNEGDWHVPYYKDGYWTPEDVDFTLDQALKISTSCCAQTSFRKNDDSLEKAERLFSIFFDTDHIHASPAEHQGTPIFIESTRYADTGGVLGGINHPFYPDTWQKGITHVTKEGVLYSGNLRGWVQHRQLIPNHVKKD